MEDQAKITYASWLKSLTIDSVYTEMSNLELTIKNTTSEKVLEIVLAKKEIVKKEYERRKRINDE